MPDERFTNFYIDYNIEDTSAKQDATFSYTGDQMEFTNISRIRYDNKDLRFDRMTFEHNFNILDGTKEEMENDSGNILSFRNNTTVNNSIIFKERDDNTIEIRSSSQVDHNEAIYPKTFTISGEASGTTYYLNAGVTGGSASTYYVTYSINSRTYTVYGNETSPVTVTVTGGNRTILMKIHVVQNYFVEAPVTFHPIISKVAPPYVTTVVPYFTEEMSGEQGEWMQGGYYPSIDVNFTREHSSVAFVLRFLDDFPLQLKLTFYDIAGEMIESFIQDVYSNDVIINRDVMGYARVHIEFWKTLPFRYIKFTSFIFGTIVTWDDTMVRDATLVQQTDRISKNISIDTLSFTLIDDGSELNLGNPKGINAYFQKNQYMLPYEIVNGKKISLGKYYLKTLSENTNLGKISAQSYLGLMDEVTFNDGAIYSGKQAGVVIEQIFQTMGLTDYIIDAETYEQPLYGTITPKSCRKALNEILFACNSVINAHDMENIIITKTSEVQRPDIPKSSKFSTTVTKNDYAYGVEVKYTSYTIKDKTKDMQKLVEGVYDAGEHTVYFTQPYGQYEISGGKYKKANYYYVTFTTTATSSVTIRGVGYNTVTSSQIVTHKKLKSGEEEKIVSYSTSLCNANTAKMLASKLLNYLTYDLKFKIKWLADGNDMGDLHIVENPVNKFNDYYGVFIKRSFDLTGGFIDTAEMVGTTLQHNAYKYTRDTDVELYSGEDDGII